MEFAVFFQATIVAILNIFTFTNCSQNVSASAPFAFADHQLLSFLELESKWHVFGLPVLDDDVLTLVKVDLVHPESRIQQRLHGLPGKLDSAIFFDLDGGFLAVGAVTGGGGLAAGGGALLVPLSNFPTLVKKVALPLCCFGVVKPEPNIVNIQIESGRVQRVGKSQFEIF